MMELEARMAELQAKMRQHREVLETEEAAKTTLVLPFLQALGYDVFNPSEVRPEFTCDVGTKKGEKVDYAVCLGGEVKVLIECKPVTNELSIKEASQLFRYFAATTARVSILTNGVVYKFFTDSERPNMMDEKPFFTFSLESFRKGEIKHLAAFHRTGFDVEQIVSQAGMLKLQSLVSAELRKEFGEPSDDFIKLIASRLHDGRSTESVRERFKAVIIQAVANIIRDGVNERLESAMTHGVMSEPSDELIPTPEVVETTQVEIDGFNIIRAICSKAVSPTRIVMRDSKSYCAVLLDDNNRKSLARLYFNSPTTRYLGLLTGKNEVRHKVDGPVDIYQYTEILLERIQELEHGRE